MKNSTIEKYFFSNRYNGEDLLKLGFIDILSSVWQKESNQRFAGFNLLIKRINELKKLGKDRQLPQALLNGNEIMQILKIKAGEEVGKILDNLREKQLSGEIKTKQEAREFVKKINI
jgi:tRNA nucleotidyltransferase/poly(A) polymerase